MAWAWAATMPLVAILAAAIWWLLAGLSRLWI
jgi:hypothetical protein